ncbi:MAG: HlyD family type I secretion periplasmic adaptor subunit [Pseudomonadota bacterium]
MWTVFNFFSRKSPIQKAAEQHKKAQPRFAAFLVMTLGAMVSALLILAANTQVPQITRAPGVVIPSGSYGKIESVDGGIVEAIHVRDGARVEQGDVLLDLRNPQLIREAEELQDNLEIAQSRYANVVAALKNLNTDSNDQMDALADMRFAGLSTAATRLELHYGGQDILRLSIEQKNRTVNMLDNAVSLARQRSERQLELVENKKALSDRGLVTINEYHNAISRSDDAIARLADTEVRLVEAEESLVLTRAQLRENRLVLIEELVREKSDLEAETRRLKSAQRIAEERLNRQRVVTAHTGVIQFTTFPSVGEFIEPGQAIFEILPVNQNLVIEAKVPNSDHGHIETGQQVSISFDNFDTRRYGKANGVLSSFSPIPLTDEMTGETYFRAFVTLDDPILGTSSLTVPIQAGFTNVTEMVTGESSLLSYIVRPVERTLKTAFSERQ